MQKHTKIYLKALGYDLSDQTQFFECERTGNRAVDIHHIISRGRGGDDKIENLMALTRKQHQDYGDKQQYIFQLLLDHEMFLKEKGVKYNQDYMNELKQKYAHVK